MGDPGEEDEEDEFKLVRMMVMGLENGKTHDLDYPIEVFEAFFLEDTGMEVVFKVAVVDLSGCSGSGKGCRSPVASHQSQVRKPQMRMK